MTNESWWSQYQKHHWSFGNVLHWLHLVLGLEDGTHDQKFLFLSILVGKLCHYPPSPPSHFLIDIKLVWRWQQCFKYWEGLVCLVNQVFLSEGFSSLSSSKSPKSQLRHQEWCHRLQMFYLWVVVDWKCI